jgi:flagellar basal body rod protein FlgG
MIRGLYSAATALDVASQQQEITAHNLAHMTVNGFSRRGLAFSTFDRTLTGEVASGAPLGTQISQEYDTTSQGPVVYTGGPLDAAAPPNHVLQGPDGPVYTRDGVFQRSTSGQLQNASGLPLLGDGGPIQIPPTTLTIRIGEDGSIYADDQIAGKMQLARFTNPGQLRRVGTTLFTAPDDIDRQPANAPVQPGYRESSNVEPATEMVTLIRTSRYFEAAQRALRAISEAVQLNTRPGNN